MKFTIGLDGSGAAEAAKKVEALADDLPRKTQELVRRLAERGVEVARVSYSAAAYDGVNDVIVNFEERGETTMAVVANGSAVLFIEFGAGVHFPGQHPEPLGFSRGTYGKGQGANDYWFYTGQPGTAGGELAHGHTNTTITHGNPPSVSLYNARKEVGAVLYEIAREVFG